MNQIPSAGLYLSIEERKTLMQKEDWKSIIAIFINYSIIIFCLWIVYVYPNPLIVILSLIVLGGQQLGVSILMHDSSHHSLFKSKKVNDWVGNWLGAHPVFNNMLQYRPYHQVHHLHAGTDEDPDLMLTRGYPTDRKSMYRKFFRDFTGQTGIRAYIALFAMHLGYIRYTQSGDIERVDQADRIPFKRKCKNMAGPIMCNLIIFSLISFFLHPAMYLFWVLGLLTTFQVSVRVRSIAEHSIIEDKLDPNKNTRTTYANWIERLLFAPYHVNYHLEHHMLMTVPFYNLPKMHSLIKKRGFYNEGTLANNYWEILKLAGSSQERNLAKSKV